MQLFYRNPGAFKYNMFSFFLSDTQSGSELYLGGVNEAKLQRPINWSPVTQQAYWQIGGGAAYVNGQATIRNQQVIVDTGTTLIYAVSISLRYTNSDSPLHLAQCNGSSDLQAGSGRQILAGWLLDLPVFQHADYQLELCRYSAVPDVERLFQPRPHRLRQSRLRVCHCRAVLRWKLGAPW